MAPADTSELDAAVVAALLADTQLSALMTDGIYFDIAPQGKTRFVIVSVSGHVDEPMFADASDTQKTRAFEQPTYLVKAVSKETSGVNAKNAAKRIDAVLQNATLSPTGYNVSNVDRVGRIRYTEIDDNGDDRWQHRGGLYQVTAAPT